MSPIPAPPKPRPSCARGSCDEPRADDGIYCTPLCRRIAHEVNGGQLPALAAWSWLAPRPHEVRA